MPLLVNSIHHYYCSAIKSLIYITMTSNITLFMVLSKLLFTNRMLRSSFPFRAPTLLVWLTVFLQGGCSFYEHPPCKKTVSFLLVIFRHIKVTKFYVQFLSLFMFWHISQFRAMFYVHRSPHSRIGRLNAATAKLQSPKSGCNRFL